MSEAATRGDASILSIAHISPWRSPAALPLAQQVFTSSGALFRKCPNSKNALTGVPSRGVGLLYCMFRLRRSQLHRAGHVYETQSRYLLGGPLSGNTLNRGVSRETQVYVLDRNEEEVFVGAGTRQLCS